MDIPPKLSIVSMTILEYLAKQKTPRTAQEIKQSSPPKLRDRVAPILGRMSSSKMIKGAKTTNGAAGFVIDKHGQNILKNKKKIEIVEYVSPGQQNLKHPDTGEPISYYKLLKIRRERGEVIAKGRKRKDGAPDISASRMALPNVSDNADNLMNHISALIHENSSYRDFLQKIGSEIAYMLGMRLVPKDQQPK